jgi:hypothetical protein
MPEPVAAPPPTAALLQPRRRRSRAVLVLLAIAAVLAGRGLGWLGGGDAGPSASPSGPAAAPADAAPVAHAPAAPSVATPTLPSRPTEAPPAATSPAAPATESSPVPAAPPEAVLASRPPVAEGNGVEADRFASLLSLVSARRQQGELGGALAALQRALTLPLNTTQRHTIEATTHDVRAALDEACRQVLAALGAGDVLAARERCRLLLAEGAESAGPALATALQVPAGSLDRVPERGAVPWPIAAPLPRDRVVRTQLPTGATTGRVVDGRSDQVTLRIETAHGVTFPTLAVTACEPVDPTADEAVELGLAALQAGDGLLARLWLCCARLRGAADVSPRGRRLQEILQ